MSSSRKQPVRSAQLIAQYGVGAMIVGKGGTSYLVAGLDPWFAGDLAAGGAAAANKNGSMYDENEFIVREPRLEARLGVKSFRTPPEFREPRRGMVIPNTGLTIPVLRFPQWHICPRCGLMEHLPLTQTGKVFCRCCRAESGFYGELAQMSFIALCERGHLQDFPWREWAHREPHPACRGDLYYLRSGGGTLAGQKIKCECGATRSLLNIDKANFSDTYLSFHLSKKGGIYTCRGHRPWLGETIDTDCPAYLRGNPRNAGNVFFAQTMSAIGLPEGAEQRITELRQFLAEPEVAGRVRSLKLLGEKNIARLLKVFYPVALHLYCDEQISEELNFSEQRISVQVKSSRVKVAVTVAASAAEDGDGNGDNGDDSEEFICSAPISSPPESLLLPSPLKHNEISETDFRYAEYKMLREPQDSEQLLSRRVEIVAANSLLGTALSRVLQIHRLRETRVYTGFSRIHSDNAPPLIERRRMLRRESGKAGKISSGAEKMKMTTGQFGGAPDWLPATTVFGEGIYLEFNEERLRAWERAQSGGALNRHLAAVSIKRGGSPRRNSSPVADGGDGKEKSAEATEAFSPRFILIHTFVHLLINQLSFDSGYNSSAIRERLYVSGHKETAMSGALIYTADGDSAGTLGGLVRLATPEYLEKLFAQAISGARWCASDPACSEIGVRYGQGPENRNLAACHACALLPETSCEQFNQYLDRALVVDLPGAQVRGYFESF